MRKIKLSLIYFFVLLIACLVSYRILADTFTVGTVSELVSAVNSANNNSGPHTIFVEDGTYYLTSLLIITGNEITVRSLSGIRGNVILRGEGMDGGVSHIFLVEGDSFTAQDMTLRDVANHGIQLQPGTDNLVVRNIHFLDAYEQLLKISYSSGDMSIRSDNGLVEDCLFEYSAGIGPQYYIGGIDGHNCVDWVVRDNIFRYIRSPDSAEAEHAIHFWTSSEGTLVERNLIVNCDRGIGFGLGSRGHERGIIRNNMIFHNIDSGFRDVGIGLESVVDAQVYNNTVIMNNSYPRAIEYRFSATTGVLIVNNLTNKLITSRDDGSGTVTNNVTEAELDWFVDEVNGDLHLNSAVDLVVDQGIAVAGLTDDYDEDERPAGSGIDIGADEYSNTINGFSHSTKVESTNDVPVIVERAMYWDSGNISLVGGHNSIGATNTATAWYLAEGCTNEFDTWVLIQNPNTTAATVKITFVDRDGNTEIVNDTVDATSRSSYDVNTYMSDKDVSTKVESVNDVGLVVERAMYWDSAAVPWGGDAVELVGGHASLGATNTAAAWYLAEGCTSNGYETWICILNPNSVSSEVRLTYMDNNGQTESEEYIIYADRRFSRRINDVNSMNDKDGVATKIETINDVGVVVERSMYWNEAAGGHCSLGVTTPALTWYLAEGSTSSGYHTWVCIQNPNNITAEVRLTYMAGDGSTFVQEEVVSANRRFTRSINDVTIMNNRDSVAVKIESINDVPIIVERAMYWDKNGIDNVGGHCSIGVTTPDVIWYLAEGSTETGFNEWILIQNPSEEFSAAVSVTFMKQNGETLTESYIVGTTSRKTIHVNEL